MASQTPADRTGGAGRITFEVERVEPSKGGQLLVCGRWSGVRGRRFVRPTLTFTLRSEGTERRALADLEHKPWAAEDGELWTASFPVSIELDDAEQLELSVAPDVAVDLAKAGASKRGRGARLAGARDARAPRVLSDRVPARPSAADRAQALERFEHRISAAEEAAEREHTRRQAADRALEEERSESLRLRSELGRVRAELDLAATTRSELSAASTELDGARKEAAENGQRLQAAIRALDQQRAESERLRMRLTAAEATIQRLTRAKETAEQEAKTESPERGSVRMSRATQASVEQPTAAYTLSDDDPTVAGTPAAFSPRRDRQERSTEPHYSRSERRRNPSLRDRPNWIGRALALLVMLAVIAAIVLLIHSTVA